MDDRRLSIIEEQYLWYHEFCFMAGRRDGADKRSCLSNDIERNGHNVPKKVGETSLPVA